MADLGVSQVSISKRADGAIFDVSVRITNVGTETVNLPGDVLGVAMRRTANHQAFPERRQIGNVNVVSPGSSVTISASLPRAYVIGSYNRLFITGLERGPDAPRCAYDANRSNDSLSLSYPDMIAAFDGGLATFTKTADWAR